MNIAFLRVGCTLASALPCLAPAMAFAAPFTLIRSVPKTLTPAALSAAEKTQTPGGVSPDGKLTFTQMTVRLVAVTGPESDMLSYRIGGLRNPTLVFLEGASVRLLFVNADDDMPHDLRLKAAGVRSSVGTPPLAPRSARMLHAEEMTLRVPDAPGTYSYFCTVRGHAQGGMVGKVVVR